MRKPKPKKGISTMLAVIILIIIMLAASLLVFAYFSAFFGNAAKNCEVLVLNPKLYCDLQGQNAFVTFTVKNVGSQPVTNLTLTICGVTQQLEVSDSDPIFPGKSRGFKADLPGTYVVGNRYAYSILALNVNGNSFALTNTLMCSWYTGTGEQAKVDFTNSPLASEDTKRWILNPAPSIVADTASLFGTPQRCIIQAQDLFWVFYSDEENLVYKTSSNGKVWSNVIVIRPCETSEYFSVWYDGVNLHYVYAKPECGESLFYRSGGLGADGNITWNAPEQEVLTSLSEESYYDEYYSYFFMPFVSVDSAGYPWISYGYYYYHYHYSPYGPYGGSEYYEYYYTASVVKSSTKDGTWTQDLSYDLINSSYGDWMTSILPLTNEKMIAVYTVQWDLILSQVWDGATWHPEQNSPSGNEGFWSAVTWGDNAYLVYAGCDGESSLSILYINYSFTTDSWSSNFALQPTSYPIAPQLCVDPATGDLYCFWITSNFDYDQLEPNVLYFKKYTAATSSWDTEPIMWVAGAPYHDEIRCSYSLEEDRIGCIWANNPSAGDTLFFNFLGQVSTAPSGIILTVDGVDYDYQDLPISFNWSIGSTHPFAWKPIVGVSESTYQWNATSGLSTEEQGNLVLTSGGEVTATYKLKLETEVIVSANGFNDLSAVSNSTVLTVDDTDYTVSEIPTAFFWDPGSSHTFSWRDKITEAGPYYWIKTFGVNASRLGILTTPNGFGALFAIYEERPAVNFSTVGVPTSNEDYVITIDGDRYTTDNLTSQQWSVGSTHSFEWHDTVMISGTPYVYFSSSGLSTQEADTLTILSGGGSITAIYLEEAAVTFNVQNLPNDTQGLVLSSDSVDCYYSDLPYVLIGNINSSHTFQWISPVVDSLGNSYSWVSTTGGLVTAQSGVLVLDYGGGNVTATYQQLTLVRTDEVSQITDSSATLNGALTSGTCDQRGFDWGTQSGIYSNEWTEPGFFGLGSFSHSISTTGGVTYYFRAKAHGLSGWVYGNEKSFNSGGWLEGFAYRQSHVIQFAAGAGTDYQVRIAVHYGSGTSSGPDVYLSNHCRTDFGDVRFTRSDGSTLLDYWMESYTSSSAVFWVEVADDLSTVAATIYVYYGKADATTASNGPATFILYEDWNGPLTGWNSYNGANWASGTYTNDGSPASPCSYNKHTTGSTGGDSYWWKAITKQASQGLKIIENTRVLIHSTSGAYRWICIGWIFDSVGVSKYAAYLYYNTNAGTDTGWMANKEISSIAEIQGLTSLRIAVGSSWSNGWNWGDLLEARHDRIRVRVYVDPEPSHGSWGSEENAPIGMVNGQFEKGGFTGWDTVVGSSQVSTNSPYCGTYCAFLSVIPGARCEIVQNFATPVPVSAIASFSLWAKRIDNINPPALVS